MNNIRGAVEVVCLKFDELYAHRSYTGQSDILKIHLTSFLHVSWYSGINREVIAVGILRFYVQ
jgi:hypothetical protein